ncbi:hypothetical protein HU200_028517 [Digitaria exilis]|uniref:Uncharacterized protein n=1 Tax=Digitaria exilis TaxID=1010633 RepID=A0A835BRS0_9POAL|nr:hypothetical protein HU200_028517 [Digitaria exilis]
MVTGGGCPGTHRNMPMEAACLEAMAGKPMAIYKLGMGTLGRITPAGSLHEAWEYAFITVVEAGQDYMFTTMPWVRNALGITLKTRQRMTSAKAAMDRTWRRLARIRTRLPERCGLDLGAEYRAALRSLRACRDDHLAKMLDSQLLSMAKADYDRTQA